MKRTLMTILSFTFLLFQFLPLNLGIAQSRASGSGSPIGLDDILRGIEERYAGSTFTARFDQNSTLAAMDITDTASGKVFVKHPGKMRWEYEKPETQIIITDGVDLWVYRPHDRQVMVGKAPNLFGEGKGVGFISDIRQIRKSFSVSLEASRENDFWALKLIPKKSQPDVVEIHLIVEPETFLVTQVVTRNAYKDETRIALSGYQFGLHLNDSLFAFIIPKHVDVLQIDEER